MKKNPWENIEEIFQEARECHGEERSRILDKLCGSDHAVRRKVELLLQNDESTPDFLARSAIEMLRVRLEPGTLIGPYKILDIAGIGGMGQVYRALDPRLKRTVAIKALPVEFAYDPARLAGFEREATLLASLSHPNIAGIYDIIEVNGRRYLVLEFVGGVTLADRLQAGPLHADEAIGIALQIVSALEAAHEKGIVHRDLKPANIKISEDGTVKVLDFGLAKILEAGAGAESLQDSGHLNILEMDKSLAMGTPAYMSPEQAQANANAVDSRSDIWAFGCILYELLTGKKAFEAGNQTSVLPQSLKLEPDWNRLPARTPPQLDRLAHQCLERDPLRRMQSSKDLREALQSIRATGSWGYKTWTAAALAASLVIAFVVWYSQGEKIPRVVRNGQVTFSPQLDLDPALSPNGELLAYVRRSPDRTDIYVKSAIGKEDGINLTRDSDNVGHRWPQWSPDGTSISFLSIPSDLFSQHVSEFKVMLQTIAATGGPSRSLTMASPFGHSWSPKGDKLVFIRDGTVNVLTVVDGSVRKIAEGYEPHAPAWSPDGKWIIYASGNSQAVFSITAIGNIAPGSLWIVAADGVGGAHQLTDGQHSDTSPAWLPDSRSILFVSDRGGGRDVFQLQLSTAGEPLDQPLRITTGLNPLTISLTRDGSRLVYSLFLRKQNLWSLPIPSTEITTFESAVQITTGSQVVEGVSASPDGAWVAYDSNISGNQDIYRMRRVAGEPEQLTVDPHDDFIPAYSSKGEFIAFYSFRNGSRDIYVMSSDGTNQQQVTNDPAQERYPDWSPDGRSLVYFSDAAGLPEVYKVSRKGDGWGMPQKLASGKGGAFFPHWSPDGQSIAYSDGNNGVNIVSADGRDLRQIITRSSFPFHTGFVLWSLDGKSLYLKVNEDAYIASIWSVPAQGGAPRRLVRFDAAHAASRPEFATDGKNFFFTIMERESDIWMLDLKVSK